ncbi:TIM barrel protein [Lentilitoribacter sp. Alg239-R112]|uniref:hydroxypyruvate isomerase family protein n=1 Tax=Lentilitoribacter sp. Alg239-R112 TaxID=2305987 RepID=UPI001FCEE29A|nr:TIM barrel protein [Lentilitoribacter sp. Alg239-R112]
MIQFSANLGFLWTDRTLPDAIRAAKSAGFSAVECHWPYYTQPELVRKALEETGLPMLGLNTHRGEAGQNGLTALPDRVTDARTAIDQAVEYADLIDAQAIHVMAGFADGASAKTTFVANLHYAAEKTARTILIEPLNRHDAPDYFLQTTDQAYDIIAEVAAPNLKLMFDCYHVGRTEGDITTRLENLLPHIGHIQFASVPDRGTPDHGELNYREIFATIEKLEWNKPIGAEYKQTGPTDDSLNWMKDFC